MHLNRHVQLVGLPWCFFYGRESACNGGKTRDAASVPGMGRSPGGYYSNPLQYSCLENPMSSIRGTAGGQQSRGLQRIEHNCLD